MIKSKSYKTAILISLIIISLFIGIFPILIYFFFIPIIILVLILVLLWLTDYKVLQKIAITFIPIVIIPCCTFIWKQINTVEPETFLIPKNYKGPVRIIFNQKCGESIKYEGKRRVYEIPDDGILLTQFKNEEGFINQEYYVLENGKRRKIEELMVQDFNEDWSIEKNPHEPSRDKLAIFYAGRAYSDGSSEFYICTYRDLNKYYEFKYEQERDSLINVKENNLKKSCR